MKQSDNADILKAVDEILPQLAKALGRESLSYSEMMEIFQKHSLSPLVRGVALNIAMKLAKEATDSAGQANITLDNSDAKLQRIATEQQLEALLSSEPGASPEQVEAFVNMFKQLLPNTKRELQEAIQILPNDPGGRPGVGLPQRQEIGERVSQQLAVGKKLREIAPKLARQYDLSPSTIKRVWYDYKRQLDTEPNEEN